MIAKLLSPLTSSSVGKYFSMMLSFIYLQLDPGFELSERMF